MKLTREEEEMLAGKRGYPVQKSMEILVQLGEIYGAKRMIEVSNVHMPGSSVVVAGEAGTKFVEKMAGLGGKFCALTTLNTGAVNFVLEKRDGRIRPVFLIGAGGSVALKNYVFLQAGFGVTITLAGGLFARPQVRAQLWQNGGLLDGASQTATCVGIAIGYRFAAP